MSGPVVSEFRKPMTTRIFRWSLDDRTFAVPRGKFPITGCQLNRSMQHHPMR